MNGAAAVSTGASVANPAETHVNPRKICAWALRATSSPMSNSAPAWSLTRERNSATAPGVTGACTPASNHANRAPFPRHRNARGHLRARRGVLRGPPHRSLQPLGTTRTRSGRATSPSGGYAPIASARRFTRANNLRHREVHATSSAPHPPPRWPCAPVGKHRALRARRLLGFDAGDSATSRFMTGVRHRRPPR